MPTLVQESEWGIVEIRHSWSFANSLSCNESGGPDQTILLLWKSTLHNCQNLHRFVCVHVKAIAVEKNKEYKSDMHFWSNSRN